jgi:hypothetical protein
MYVAHQRRCPAFGSDTRRCRCEPSWRGRRHNRLTGKPDWQKPVTKDRNEVLSWLGIAKRAVSHHRQQSKASPTFQSIGDEWLAGVEADRISRRKGRSKSYSATTIAHYGNAYRSFVRPEFGSFPALERDRRRGRGAVLIPRAHPEAGRVTDLPRLREHLRAQHLAA